MKKFNIKEWQNKYLTESDTIKYKSDDGEAKEMDADAAAKQPEDHPAKIAWQKAQSDDDGGEEKVKGADMFNTDEPESDDGDGDNSDDGGGEEDELESLKDQRDDLRQQRSDIKKDIRHYHGKGDKEMVAQLVDDQADIKEELEEVEEEIEMLQQAEGLQEMVSKTGRSVLGKRINLRG